MALTALSVTFQVGRVPFGVGDVLIVLVVIVMGSEITGRARVPGGYLAAVYCYLTWAVVTCFWVADLGPAVATLVQYTQFMLVTVVAFSAVSSLPSLIRCVEVYVWAATTLAVVVLVYAVSQGTYSYVYFLNYQKNYTGAIVGNALPLILGLTAIRADRRKWLLFAFLVNLGVLMITTSRGSWFATVVGVSVFLFLCRRTGRILTFALGSGIAAWSYVNWVAPDALRIITDFTERSSAYSRVIIYNDVRRFISEHFFLGSGLRSYRIEIPEINFAQDDPSNLVLLNMAEVGLVGTVLFATMLVAIYRVALRNRTAFAGDRMPLHLSAALCGAFSCHIAHSLLDVSWVRGAGTFAFACVGLLFAVSRLGARSPEPDDSDRVAGRGAGVGERGERRVGVEGHRRGGHRPRGVVAVQSDGN